MTGKSSSSTSSQFFFNLITPTNGREKWTESSRRGMASALRTTRVLGLTATRPGCTTNYTVVPGNVILDLVYYVGLEAGACLRLAGQTRYDFEYGNRKSGRRFCQTHVEKGGQSGKNDYDGGPGRASRLASMSSCRSPRSRAKRAASSSAASSATSCARGRAPACARCSDARHIMALHPPQTQGARRKYGCLAAHHRDPTRDRRRPQGVP